MKAISFEFHRPDSLAEASDILVRYDGDARVLAGGQSLMPMLNLRLVRPAAIIDLSGLAELKTIEVSATEVSVGALVTHSALEFSRESGVTFDLLRYVAAGIAYRGVRNRGTMGGSLAHADPAADWPSCLLTLDARVTIFGPDGTRQMPISDFIVGNFTVALRPGEILTRIHIPLLNSEAKWGYYKHTRKVGEFAEAIGCVIDDDARGIFRVVAGAMSAPSVVLPGLTKDRQQIITLADVRHALEEAAPSVEGRHIHFHAVAVMRALQLGVRP